MAMKYACWTSISSTDGREGTLQSSQEHDEGNIRIKEEGEIKKETCLSIPGSDRLIYEGQLVTHDGLVFTIKPEVDTDMFESLSSTEGQDLSTEQEMVYATIKQVNKEEIFEPITTHGEGGGETEQSIPEGQVFTIKQEVDTDMFESLSSAEGQDPSTEQEIVYAIIKQEDKEEIFEPITPHGEGGGETEQSIPEGLVFTIKQEVDTDMFESLSSAEGQDPSTEQEMVNATIKQEDKEEIFEPITTQGEGAGENEQSILEDDRELDNGQGKIHQHTTACSGEKSHQCLHCSKTFTDENILILHQKTHQVDVEHSHLRTQTGEKPFKCSQALDFVVVGDGGGGGLD
eukprot:XP_011679471.1 PREDICTED: zinc finger and SCAN domain-containing protein 31 [Strongylocentrotus purpuratus]